MGEFSSIPGVTLVEELGRGAHTVVYLAERAGHRYAVKIQRSAGDQQEAVSFRREAALLATLGEAGLAGIHDVGEVDGRPYLIMDLIAGHPLARTLDDAGPLPPERAIRLIRQVALTLDVAHRVGLVHRDVKPDNVMVEPGDTARLIDFGLAARAGTDVTDEAVGTFRYSAPEQTGMLRRPVDGRTDLYAVGVVLFECLTGTLPFTATDAGQLLHQHLTMPAPDVRSRRPEVPATLAAIVAKLLAKDPDDRYQTGHGLTADLDRIVAGDDGFPLGAADLRAVEPDRLIGREREAEQLRQSWQDCRSGRGTVLLLTGPPGGGKSRLARELTGQVRAGDAGGQPVLFGKCAADAAVPLAPIRQAVDGYLAGVGRRPERAEAVAQIRHAAGDAVGLLATLSPALAEVLDAPPLAAEDDQLRFAEAIADLLVGLARAHGGLVLHLDDVQWLDESTRLVLRQLARQVPEAPLLVLLTARDDEASRATTDGLADLVRTTMSVEPLDEPAVAALVRAHLGGLPVPAGLITRLTARSGGNPLAVLEYTRSVVDAGLIRPSWGTWLLDEAGLEALALPADVMELILRRIDRLGGTARQVLGVASIVGATFDTRLLSAVADVPPEAVAVAVADAVAARLVEPTDTGEHAFLHDRIREALGSEMAEPERRRLHLRIAQAMDAAGAVDDPERVYAVAGHYLAGDDGSDPAAVIRSAGAAGGHALVQHAPGPAVRFLTGALSVAHSAGIDPEPELHAALGVAAGRAGQRELAVEQLELALVRTTEPMRRAEIYATLTDIYFASWHGGLAIENAQRGLAELGYRLPGDPVPLALTALGRFAAGLLVGLLPARVRVATGHRRERYCLQVRILDRAGGGAAGVGRPGTAVAIAMQELYLAKRLGWGPERDQALAVLAMISTMVRWRRTAARLITAAKAGAATSNDPRHTALVDYLHAAMMDEFDNRSAISTHTGEWVRGLVERAGRWLDTSLYLNCTGGLALLLLIRGRAAEAWHWYRLAVDRDPGGDELLGNPGATAGPMAAALQGRPAEAAALLRPVQEFVARNPGRRAQVIQVLAAQVQVAAEQGEVGEVFDRAVADFQALGASPATMYLSARAAWIHQAFGRLAQVVAAAPGDRPRRLAAAAVAVKELRRAAKNPGFRAFHAAAAASLRQLTGDHTAALRDLARAESWAGGLDLPLWSFEAARVRARAYTALGSPADAVHHATIAVRLANDHGWQTRARWVRDEFGLETAVSRSARGKLSFGAHSARPVSRSTTAPVNLHGRWLAALEQVSLAAANVLDPAALARVTLDEIVRIFGAERAFLFLTEPADGRTELMPFLGRDHAGAEIEELTGYGSSLVERVRESGEALVVTGNEQGAALGSQSAVLHGLRSIMVAPLRHKENLLGVVYLDSRAARGIFTGDDVEILAAITNHVAMALETARAAELKVEVHSARRERDLADTLRQAMAELTAVLDADEVAARLLATVANVLPLSRLVLLHRASADAPLVVAAAVRPEAEHAGAGADRDAGGSGPPIGLLTDLLSLTEPRYFLGDRCPAVLAAGTGPDEITGWLAVPLLVRGECRGLLLGAGGGRPCSDAEVGIAATLAGQGIVALDNALLFQRTTSLAERDALTGLFNRRRFTDLADRVLNSGGPVAAVMADIDHFKNVNDTHGHGVGDQVIQAVGARLASQLRSDDIICRYGGEEFAILLVDTTADDARKVADRLHAAVGETTVATDDGELAVTVSVGLARGGEPVLQTLLNRADTALYEAKRAGRNQVAENGS